MTALETSQILGNYGEFIGAIAVVLTLVYLSIQVRANTRSTQSQSLVQGSGQYQSLFLARATSRDLRTALEKIERGETLEANERIGLASWYVAMMNLLDSYWVLAGVGTFGKGAEYEGLKSVIQGLLATPWLAAFVDSAEHPPFDRNELKRHYNRLVQAADSFSATPRGFSTDLERAAQQATVIEIAPKK